jgi:hypothetical protein
MEPLSDPEAVTLADPGPALKGLVVFRAELREQESVVWVEYQACPSDSYEWQVLARSETAPFQAVVDTRRHPHRAGTGSTRPPGRPTPSASPQTNSQRPSASVSGGDVQARLDPVCRVVGVKVDALVRPVKKPLVLRLTAAAERDRLPRRSHELGSAGIEHAHVAADQVGTILAGRDGQLFDAPTLSRLGRGDLRAPLPPQLRSEQERDSERRHLQRDTRGTHAEACRDGAVGEARERA